jgi:HemY protein
MIRVLFFIVLVAGLAFGAAWLADRPGEVTIVWPWLGRAIEIPLGLVIAVIAVIIGLWAARHILRTPGRVSGALRHRREARGFHAISRGLIAIGAGDLAGARRFAGDARRLAPNEPLALLLAAQTAQLAGNRDAAETTFRRMTEHDATKMLGLHGLFIEARRRNDPAAARAVAEDAVRANPAAGWAAQAVLDFRCMAGDWAGGLAALDSQMKSGLIDKPTYRRGRAVLLTARALSSGDRDAALADVTEAVKLAPGLVPAAALAGRLLAEAGKPRPASRIIQAAWRINPHPDLAETYANVRPGEAARERLARVQGAAQLAPPDLESDREARLAVARAAIDAREFAVARTQLEPLLAAPSRRVALMMAEVEEHDTGDFGRARAWMARALNAPRDPAWTADGYVSDKWLPVSPVTGRLDAFQWKVPLADLSPPGRVIEEVAPAAVPAAPALGEGAGDIGASPRSAPRADEDAPGYDGSPHAAAAVIASDSPLLATRTPAGAGSAEARGAQADANQSPPLAHASASDVSASSRRRDANDAAPAAPRTNNGSPRHPNQPRRDEAVIPLLHSPDDPGPDGDLPPEPRPEPPTPEPWWRGLFR